MKLTLLDHFNNNKLVAGIMMILLNIGSRYLVDEFSTNPKERARNIILRRIGVFAMCFIATRDLVVSLILTAGFVILASGVAATPEGFETKKKPTLESPYASDPPLSTSQ